jgi:uncharacterized membrane protein
MDGGMQADRIVFEASLRPHRSLSPRQVLLAGGGMAGASLFITCCMYRLGAWPVIGFDTADIILALVLLWLNVRAARAVETIRLSEREIAVMRVDAGGRREAFALPCYWLKIDLRERAGTVPMLVLIAGGQAYEVARMLGEVEKRDLAGAMLRALDRLRNPRFDNPQLG